jgi:hypothetical protein
MYFKIFVYKQIFSDSIDVWTPPQSSDSSITERKNSHVWHNAPVHEWSKEQVRIS